MRYSIVALTLLGLHRSVQAQSSCSSDNATPIDNIGTDSGSGSGSGTVPGSGVDPGAAAIASIQVAGASNIADLTGTNLNSGGVDGPAGLIDLGDSPPLRRLLMKRAALSCDDGEKCYSLQGDPFCANDQSGDFHLDDGTTGNLNTGDYQLPDGQEGNFNNGPFPTLSASGTSDSGAIATSAAASTASSNLPTTEASETTDAPATAAESTPAGATRSGASAAATESGDSSLTRASRTTSPPVGAATSTALQFQETNKAASPLAGFADPKAILLIAMGMRAML